MEPRIRDLFDESRRDYGNAKRPRPVRTYTWHPTTPGDTPPPVVLISHGTGGSARQMAWLAEALASTGFLAVSVDHHGNNFVDGYLPQGFAFEWERPRDLAFALDTIATEQPVGLAGTAGFSSGGYTSAALTGARIDSAALRAVLNGQARMPEVQEFPDLLNALTASVPREDLAQALTEADQDYTDDRVRAAFLICPAIGEMITSESLKAVDLPVEIRWGDADTIAPPEANALRYLDLIPTANGRSAGTDVQRDHFLGGNPDGAKTRRRTASEAVDFFRAHLWPGQGSSTWPLPVEGGPNGTHQQHTEKSAR